MISRRSFCQAGAGIWALASEARADVRYAEQHRAAEWSYSSGKAYKDPFNDIELDVVFETTGGTEYRVPAFWGGGQVWRVRFAPPSAGRYRWRTICTDSSNGDLHDRSGVLEVAPYRGENALYRHGPVRVARDLRHFEHTDGTPFFWLGDTWWMGLCRRLSWPEGFQTLTADRVRKGFSVVQIVAGLYPDMPPFDPRGANEAGFPWEKDYQRINPAYFDMADVRIQYLAERGIVPCIVGCWGYFLPLMGVPRMKQHWRNLIARWGAYPAVWCLAGEGTMPFYLSQHREQDSAVQKQGWTEVAHYVRSTDPLHRLITIHPSQTARDSVEDASVLDFDMLQTGHSDRASIRNTITQVTGSLQRNPKMPVLVGEVCYEGIMEASRQEVQRFMFWSCMLSGAAGHTYGANGIWQVNTVEKPFGPSPHGRSWGDTPWETAYQLPGSAQLGLAKKLLMRYEWWRFEPHPDWAAPHWSSENYFRAYAAGIPAQVRIFFLPDGNSPTIQALERGVNYDAYFFNPVNGSEHALGRVVPDESGNWKPPQPPILQDWILVLQNG
ncbi:MAG: hypothetical protein DMG59_11120 [Acidobacteria bacterium]|nr:MAG: hypothetical protein DMG59_11120 [Acidobacteriota bacterium]